MEGIKNIFEQDVLRRTNGADLNNFDVAYWPSMNASTWEVFVHISISQQKSYRVLQEICFL